MIEKTNKSRKRDFLIGLKKLFSKPITNNSELISDEHEEISSRFSPSLETTYVLTTEEVIRTTFFMSQMDDLLSKFSDEQRKKLDEEITSVYDLFHDEKFILVYFYGDHESLIKYIEELYFSNKMNARMLRTLMELGMIELTPEDNERFGMIHLLYFWDDPLYEGQFTDEDIMNYYKRQLGIK